MACGTTEDPDMTYRREVEVTETTPPATVVQPPATVVHERVYEAAPAPAPVYESRVVYRSNPLATVERAIVFIFGLIELLIGLRIVLLLVAARQSNDIVRFIYNLSDIFVAPFRGILRIDEVQSGATALDVGAIVALVGWFVIELIVLALLRVFRPPATAV
jgi:uncharacterized protein YggT (Ycf19 family)